MKNRSLFTRCLAFLTVLSMMLLAGCGQDAGKNGVGAGSADAASSSLEAAENVEGSWPVISMNKFKSAVSEFGEAQDMTEDYGFDACMAGAEDGTYYIYMYMPTEDMAEQLAADADGDGQPDPGLELLKSGDNFHYYRQTGETDQQGIPICGYALRVDNMLILISGESTREAAVKEQAETLLKKLGYKDI